MSYSSPTTENPSALEAADGANAVRKLVHLLAFVEDPRKRSGRLHAFSDILAILVLATLCRCDSADDIEEWGKKEEKWLRKFLPLKNGIPSQDTFLRALAALEPEEFQEVFALWAQDVWPKLGIRRQIAVDGKTSRGAKKAGEKASRVHTVTAFACDVGQVLAQVSMADKTNEISTLPEFLKGLSLQGALVSIDAIAAQTEVTGTIVDGGGDYLIGLKCNQPTLHKEVVGLFETIDASGVRSLDEYPLPEVDVSEETDGGHGRIETRRARVCSDLKTLVPSAKRFKKLHSVIEIEATRTQKRTGETSTERRYYISSRKLNADEVNAAVRAHWGIENRLHWCLDMTFKEDQCRIRARNAAQNLAVVRHFAINLIRSFDGDKLSAPRRRLKCLFYRDYREKLLGVR